VNFTLTIKFLNGRIFSIEYKSITYGEEEVNFKEFECCTFTKCNFSQCAFVAVTLLIVPLMIVFLAMPKLIM
jgi:hypothetical protein